MSAMRAPEAVSGELAKHPPRKRKTMRDPIFGDKAHPTWNPVYGINETMKIFLRPYRSESCGTSSGSVCWAGDRLSSILYSALKSPRGREGFDNNNI